MPDQSVLNVPEGTLTLQPAAAGTQQKVRIYDGSWTPAPTMAQYLPPGFVWQFRVRTTANFDMVRVLPDGLGKWEQFNVKALQVGLAVAEFAGVSLPERMYDEFLYLLLLRSRRSRRWWKNHLVDARSLIGSRATGSAKTVLEELEMGSTSSSSEAMTIEQLITLGRQNCRQATNVVVSEQQLIATGLYHVARAMPCNINPLSPLDRRNVVRNALLDYPNIEPDRSLLDNVFRRIGDALSDHLEIMADPEFKWMLGSKNSFVEQIRKKSPEMERNEVNDAMAVFGWRAFQRVDAVCAKGSELLAHALESKFGAVATASFRPLFTPHPLLGGLCFSSMTDRLPLLAPAIDDLLERPSDPVTQGAIVQLLIWYREIAEFRRQTDKNYKQLDGVFVNALPTFDASEDDTSSYSATDECNSESRTTKPKSHTGQFANSHVVPEMAPATGYDNTFATNTTPGAMGDRKQLIQAIRQNVVFVCKCPTSNPDRDISLDWSEDEDEPVGVVIHECQRCGAVGTSYHTVEEFRSMLFS